MRTVPMIGSAVVALALGLGAAQAAESMAKKVDAGPVQQNSQAMEAADQAAMKPMNIRQQLQAQLLKDGYTDVTVTPSSFLVRAKDKAGNPVEMVIGPDSFTTVTEIPAGAAAATTPNPANGAAPAPASPKG